MILQLMLMCAPMWSSAPVVGNLQRRLGVKGVGGRESGITMPRAAKHTAMHRAAPHLWHSAHRRTITRLLSVLYGHLPGG